MQLWPHPPLKLVLTTWSRSLWREGIMTLLHQVHTWFRNEMSFTLLLIRKAILMSASAVQWLSMIDQLNVAYWSSQVQRRWYSLIDWRVVSSLMPCDADRVTVECYNETWYGIKHQPFHWLIDLGEKVVDHWCEIQIAMSGISTSLRLNTDDELMCSKLDSSSYNVTAGHIPELSSHCTIYKQHWLHLINMHSQTFNWHNIPIKM